MLPAPRVRLLLAAPVVLLPLLLSLDFLLTLSFDFLLALPLAFEVAVLPLAQFAFLRLTSLIVALSLPALFALLRTLNLFLPSLFVALLLFGAIFLGLWIALSLLFPTVESFL